MPQKVLFGFISIALLITTSVGAAESTEKNLNVTMRKNFVSLIQLQKLASDSKQFKDPKNKEVIASALKELDAGSGHVVGGLKQQGKTGLKAIGEIYADYVKDMADRFDSGRINYVRNRVATVSQLCLSCHTGQTAAKQFRDAGNEVETISLTPYQKVHFYAATRQFDQTLKSLDAILNKTSLPFGELREFTQAVKTGLSVAVRVKQDAVAGIKIIQKALVKPGVPEFVIKDFKAWQLDLQAWQQEKTSPGATAKQLIATAKGLIKQAQEKQDFPTDHVADVLYLRATNYLNQALQKNASFEEQAEAFYQLGRAYGTLRDALLWNLDQYYYEACIKTLPHSELSNECYRTLSNEIFFGYTGSAGTTIPPKELERLRRLRKVAD